MPFVRDRLTEFIPLMLVGLVLLTVYVARSLQHDLPEIPDLPDLPFVTGADPTPSPARVAPANVAAAPVAARQPATVPAPQPGVCTPRFQGGIALLKASLGAAMGEALECERVVDDRGDTQQKTTTGLAYYRKTLNVACFTTGWDHWALVERGVVHWVGEAVDPPPDAAVLT